MVGAITWWALFSDPSVGQRYWIVLMYELMDAVSLVYALHVAISPVDSWS